MLHARKPYFVILAALLILMSSSFRFNHIILRTRARHASMTIQPSVDITQVVQPQSFVVLSNLQSGSNIGNICRNALAFNVSEVVVVGRRSFRDKMRQADRGAKLRLNFTNFPSLAEAEAYLRQEKKCKIIGVEILDVACSLRDYPFTGSTAFMFGNEGGGLSEKQRRMCDEFVYIPQFAEGGMASINVACASALVLYSYATWANYPETQRKGEKFL